MRRALVDFHAARGTVGAEADVGDADGTAVAGNVQALERRVVELEEENRRLRELAAEWDLRLDELTRVAVGPEVVEDHGDDVGAVELGDMPGDVPTDEQADGFGPDWRLPRRNPRMPDVGVVTMDAQPDEEQAFGPAAALVDGCRELVNAGGQSLSPVEQAQAAVRRWVLGARMLGEFHLTLPPETFPLHEERRRQQVRWRRDALAEARRELVRSQRTRLLRRVATLGLWRAYLCGHQLSGKRSRNLCTAHSSRPAMVSTARLLGDVRSHFRHRERSARANSWPLLLRS